jgi:hypothetical protein
MPISRYGRGPIIVFPYWCSMVRDERAHHYDHACLKLYIGKSAQRRRDAY